MQDTLALWSVQLTASREITDWLTAIGTVGATFTAVWLAYRQGAERLRVTCRVGYQLLGTRDGGGGYLGDRHEPDVRISATNDGPWPVTVNSFAWDVRLPRALGGFVRWQPVETSGSTRLPAELITRGKEARVYVLEKHLIGEAGSISEYVRRTKIPWLTARRLRVLAQTTTGRTFYGRPHKEVLKIIRTGKMPPDLPA